MQIFARHFDDGRPIQLRIEGSQVSETLPAEVPSGAALPWVAPGFVDLRAPVLDPERCDNGDLSVEQLVKLTDELHRQGVTRCLPTLTDGTWPATLRALDAIADACEQSSRFASRIAGIHLDGAFRAADDGPPDNPPARAVPLADEDAFRRLQDAARGRIRLLTLRPEADCAPAFIRHVTDSGVQVAIGRTTASGKQIREAVQAGARLSMCLGTASHGRLKRHPNPLWDQLADDRLAAVLRLDDRELPESFVRIILRAKSSDRCLLAGGSPSHRGCPMAEGIARLLRSGVCRRSAAIAMASTGPRQALGIPAGGPEPGRVADLVLLDIGPEPDCETRVRATLHGGEWVFGCLPPHDTA